MRPPTRSVLLGAFAAAALAALAAGGWMTMAPDSVVAAEEVLPLPPEPPRLADSPEAERCFDLLRGDASAARDFSRRWQSEQGGEAAVHCEALAILGLGEASRAATLLETLATRSTAGRPARAAVFAQAAQAWMMAGDAQRAFAATTQAMALTPDDADLLVDRATALGTLGRYGEAVADLDLAIRLDANRADALVFRAAAWRQMDRTDAARRDIERALALEPRNPEALLERGILRQLAGDTEGARMDWESVQQIAPGSAAADLAAQNLALSEAGPFRR
jgi:Flp pilus assembly protein TadD